ncbi:hypothetical protein DDE83_001144 [Stemphylium lycopersici]|uniref:Uncharacterized protein n=1 Tax=Stemphylium lycopersici TaxID=183478 RepID=A0A364NEE3_STELY|nr:hypothetical protein DDE83_001144 [Stemphylium lycopersici]
MAWDPKVHNFDSRRFTAKPIELCTRSRFGVIHISLRSFPLGQRTRFRVRLARVSTTAMMHAAIVLSMLLAGGASIPAKPPSTMSSLSRRDVNPLCYFGGHQPTEETYLQGVAQYCNHYVRNGIRLEDKVDLVATITLKDTYDCPISWIYKIRWVDDAGFGPVDISNDMCVSKFHDVVDDSTCMDGQKKFMFGKKYWIEFGNKRGSKLWIETRQRNYDEFPKKCSNSLV